MNGKSSLAKAQAIVGAFPAIWSGLVVDVGCRSRELEKALVDRATTRYVGVDIHPNAEVVADLGRGLPFEDREADIVVALDVLEHTDDIFHAFSELCRTARSHVVVTLPNALDVHARLCAVRGRPSSGKYGLPLEPPSDRHRWYFSMNQARAWVERRAAIEGLEVIDERALVGPNRYRVHPIVSRWPNLLSATYLVHIERTSESTASATTHRRIPDSRDPEITT